MRCKLTKRPDDKFVRTERLVTWEGPAGVREPRPEEKEYKRPLPFKAGTFPYLHPRQLLAIPVGEKGVYRDGYGQKVFTCKERYPCFDSADFLHEKRYYHWVYLTGGGKLVCVYYDDDDRLVTVTEDVAKVPGEHFKAMEEAGLVDENGYLDL